MAYNLKTPKEKKEKDNLYAVPKGLTEDEDNFYDVEKQESSSDPEQKDLFTVPEENEEEKSEELFSMKSTEQEHIDEINADLYAEDSKIKIKDKNTLLVNSDGKEHEIKKQDMINYHERYRLDGVDGHDISGFRHLGSISGNWELVDDIYKDSNRVFNRIDENTNSYKTLPSEDD
jgi:hypothetical protein